MKIRVSADIFKNKNIKFSCVAEIEYKTPAYSYTKEKYIELKYDSITDNLIFLTNTENFNDLEKYLILRCCKKDLNDIKNTKVYKEIEK